MIFKDNDKATFFEWINLVLVINLPRVNPSLKNIQFEKYHDPYTVFQNVERYIWNDMITTSDFEDNISNQDKIESHGFNEWSFRKPSTKSK